MLTQGQLDAMRETVRNSLAGTAVLSAGTLVSDGAGGSTRNFAPYGTIPARLAPIRGDERLLGERLSEDSDWMVTLDVADMATPLDESHQIQMDGRTFHVTAVHGPRTYEVSRRVEVREVG